MYKCCFPPEVLDIDDVARIWCRLDKKWFKSVKRRQRANFMLIKYDKL
ncbi:hypothetical protein KSZ_24080 [Dictyobacter formicarum]|uniref:Uncharacterized protein n=1 Tax=Dictyobacter formicarum TaxID=2778368 RepID=A0ABQ3VE18_9CHLR|nr:hypothetical protein KSZ_24080 [Dictyobacter formicarum]